MLFEPLSCDTGCPGVYTYPQLYILQYYHESLPGLVLTFQVSIATLLEELGQGGHHSVVEFQVGGRVIEAVVKH